MHAPSPEKTQPKPSCRHDTGRDLRHLVLPLIIVALTALAYSNSLSCSFVLDDLQNIVRNPKLFHFLDSLLRSSRPLTNATFFFNHRLGGLQVEGYHWVNLLIHMTCALLLFGIVRRTLLLPRWAHRFDDNAPALAAVIACMWAVHPVQTAAVTYIIQRAESLMSMFYLSTLYCVIAGSQSERSRRWYTTAVIMCAAGMTAKPTMVTAPLIVALYDMTFLSNGIKKLLRYRRKLYIALASTWLVLAALLSLPNESSSSIGMNPGMASPGGYLITQADVVIHYLRLLIEPSVLCLDYAWPVSTLNATTVLKLMALAATLAVAVWGLARGQRSRFLILWFFIIIAPTSSILPVADLAFDHRIYLATAGPIAAFVLSLYVLLQTRVRTHLMALVALAMIGILCSMTYARNMDYLSEEIMWRDVVLKRPSNLRAVNNLAVALSERGAFAEAMACYMDVLQKIPEQDRRRLNRGEITSQSVIPANSLRANYFRAHANLGLLHYLVRQDRPTALRHYDLALGVNPSDAGVRAKRERVTKELAELESAR